MNLPHTAALALVGWYLMMPPSMRDRPLEEPRIPDLSAPLAQWTIRFSYDSAGDCERGLSVLMDNAKSNGEKRFASVANCIATDDPRLRQK